MPTVKKEIITFDGAPFTREVRCNSVGVFSIQLPNNIMEVLGVDEVHGDTLAKVFAAWNSIVSEYTKACTTERTVIAYRVTKPEDMFFERGYGIMVWAKVYIESKTEVKGREPHFKYREVPFHARLPAAIENVGSSRLMVRDIRDSTIIDWSQEVYDFFVAIDKAMKGLVDQLGSLGDEKELFEVLNSGRLISYLSEKE